jgi:hypothetical protein
MVGFKQRDEDEVLEQLLYRGDKLGLNLLFIVPMD